MMIDLLGNAGDDYGATILASLDTQENEPNLKAELEKEGIIMLAPVHRWIWGILRWANATVPLRILKGKTIRTFGGVQD